MQEVTGAAFTGAPPGCPLQTDSALSCPPALSCGWKGGVMRRGGATPCSPWAPGSLPSTSVLEEPSSWPQSLCRLRAPLGSQLLSMDPAVTTRSVGRLGSMSVSPSHSLRFPGLLWQRTTNRAAENCRFGISQPGGQKSEAQVSAGPLSLPSVVAGAPWRAPVVTPGCLTVLWPSPSASASTLPSCKDPSPVGLRARIPFS